MFRKLLYVLCLAALTGCEYEAITAADLQEGDILLQDLDCGPACDAIEKVTVGYNGLDFSHCGIVANIDGQLKVVEAYGVVQAVPVATFLNRSMDNHDNPKVIVGRPKEQAIAMEAARASVDYIGKPYDEQFRLEDDKYYCSELLYETFKTANAGKPFFPLNVMTFKEPDSAGYMPFWIDYYEDLGKPIPEGDSGINPGAISRSPKLDILLIRNKKG